MKTMGRLWRVYSSDKGMEAEEDIISLFLFTWYTKRYIHEN
jgi:hypothetical protein